MKQKEAIRMFGAEPSIEVLDTRARGGENRRIAGQLAGIGVSEIAEDREMDARIEVPQREHLDVLQQRRHRGGARQHRGHDDHRAGVVWNAIGEIEARQATRRDRPRDHALSERDRDVGRGDQEEQHQGRQGAAQRPPACRPYAATAASSAAVTIAMGPR